MKEEVMTRNICKNIWSLIISMILSNLFIYLIGYYKLKKRNILHNYE